jgi:hypothetical protein
MSPYNISAADSTISFCSSVNKSLETTRVNAIKPSQVHPIAYTRALVEGTKSRWAKDEKGSIQETERP